jgi:hypothetical protein
LFQAAVQQCNVKLDETRTLTFKPGPVGIDYDYMTGHIVSAKTSGQAYSLGVRAGWQFAHVAGYQWNDGLWEIYQDGQDDYTLTFYVPIPPDTSAADSVTDVAAESTTPAVVDIGIDDIESVVFHNMRLSDEQRAKCEESTAIKGVGPETERPERRLEAAHEGFALSSWDDACQFKVRKVRKVPKVRTACVSGQSKFRWMWGDAGVAPLPLSNRLAKQNPFRWSRLQNTQETIAHLQMFLTYSNVYMRPVRLEIRVQEQSFVLVFASIPGALSYLSG